jgi:hypothetical protein
MPVITRQHLTWHLASPVTGPARERAFGRASKGSLGERAKVLWESERGLARLATELGVPGIG